MAVKNHALDAKIVAAARGEFREKGFRAASVHAIAQRAGITTGALYTRYKNKDDLFRSLVQPLLDGVQTELAPLAQGYAKAHEQGAEAILAAIRAEEQVYLRLLREYSDDCFLLFCRSDGSALEQQMTALMARKAEQTAEYLKTAAKTQLDPDGVTALMAGQFHFFREILSRGYPVEKTLNCMKTVELYMEAGWRAVLQAIL